MPRKKKPQTIIKYFIPKRVEEKIEEIVNNCKDYGIHFKNAWKHKYYYIIDYIYIVSVENQLDKSKGYVNINQEITAGIIGANNQEVSGILDRLVKAGILKRDNKCKVGEKSYGYKLKTNSELDEVCLPISAEKSNAIILNTRKAVCKGLNTYKYMRVLNKVTLVPGCEEGVIGQVLGTKKHKEKVRREFAEFLSLINAKAFGNLTNTFQFVAILPTINNNYTNNNHIHNGVNGTLVPCTNCEVSQRVRRSIYAPKRERKQKTIEPDTSTVNRIKRAVYHIRSQRMIPVRYGKGRVYTEITRLNREFRSKLLLDGKHLIGMDIRNSQPLLAAVLFREYWKDKGPIPKDVLEYQADCEAGRFYDYFMELNGIPQDLRAEFKASFFKEVYFSKISNYKSVLKDQFIAKYPSCWKAIYKWKGGFAFSPDYRRFAQVLQELEARIIFDKVNIGLIDRGIDSINIFDSLYVTTMEHFEIAKKLTLEAFKSYGITPTINYEYYH